MEKRTPCQGLTDTLHLCLASIRRLPSLRKSSDEGNPQQLGFSPEFHIRDGNRCISCSLKESHVTFSLHFKDFQNRSKVTDFLQKLILPGAEASERDRLIETIDSITRPNPFRGITRQSCFNRISNEYIGPTERDVRFGSAGCFDVSQTKWPASPSSKKFPPFSFA